MKKSKGMYTERWDVYVDARAAALHAAAMEREKNELAFEAWLLNFDDEDSEMYYTPEIYARAAKRGRYS